MNILLLSRYGRLGQSSRIRSYQYLPYLRVHGVDVTVAPLLDDDYLKRFHAGERGDPRAILGAYLERFGYLLKSRRFDLLWIEYEILPWLPGWAEAIITQMGIPYLVDYDDAIFHRYDMHPKWMVRALLRKKIDGIMRRAALVMVGNDYLADRAHKAGASRVVVLPTAVDLERYSIVSRGRNTVFTIGWIGSPTTAEYLHLVGPALKKVCGDGSMRLVLVGSGQIELDGTPIEFRSWSEASEVKDILSFDVGIMPLSDTHWAWGKCGYKLIQYMACVLPVVASPVGVNTHMVKNNQNGFLAFGTDDWVRALITLRRGSKLRERMGKAGRSMVEKHYCLEVTAPRLLSLLKSSAGGANG